MKYIYILKIKINYPLLYGSLYYEDDIYSNIYYDYNSAKIAGIETIKESINRYRKYIGKQIKEAYEDANIEFIITKVSCDYVIIDIFDNSYYYENISKIKSKDKYDFIMSICNNEQIFLDHKGNIIDRRFNDCKMGSTICSPKSFEYNKKYHLNNFKIGDKVKPKNDFEGIEGKVYEIFDIINKDKHIKDSDDPLYFKQGYMLTDIYNEYCNKYITSHFDEDLIKISDEEYNRYYRDWNWYNDDNEIIGTYDDYISGKLNKD